MSAVRRLRAVPLFLAALGAAAMALSFAVDSPPPAAVRLLAIALLTAAGLTASLPATRGLVRALAGAFSGWATAASLVVIVAAAIVARLVWIDLDLRYDEAYTYLQYATKPLSEGMETYNAPNNHLLHTFLLHGSWRLFGESLGALRLPALLAGIAVVPATYLAGRALYGREAGLVAAALAVGSAGLIEYSVNARGYTLTWLAFLATIVLGARLVRRRDPAAWTLFVAAGTLGLYAVPTMALALATVGVWMALCFLVERKPLRILELVAAGAVTGLLSALLYLTILDEPGWDYRAPPPGGLRFLAEETWKHALQGFDGTAQVIVLSAIAAGIVLHRRVGLQRVSLPLVTIVVTFLLGRFLPDPPPFVRSWLYLAPVVFIAVGAGAATVVAAAPQWRPRMPALAAGLAIVTMLIAAIGQAPYVLADAPIVGAKETARWMKLQPAGTTFFISDDSIWPLTLRRVGVPTEILTLTYDVKGKPPPLFAVSRTRGESIGVQLTRAGLPPETPTTLLVTFGEVDVYRAG